MITRAGLIRGRTAAMGFTIPELAKRTGMNKMTLYNRLKDPGSFRIREISALDRQIHMTDEEIIALVRRQK